MLHNKQGRTPKLPQLDLSLMMLIVMHAVWRREELQRIDETTSGPERKAALCALLEQEAQLIASIGRHKIAAGEKNKEQDIKNFLDKVQHHQRKEPHGSLVRAINSQTLTITTHTQASLFSLGIETEKLKQVFKTTQEKLPVLSSFSISPSFTQTAAAKRWTAFDGNITEMDTPFTLRAQQLRDIYNSITLKTLSRDERLDVLLTLKCTVKVSVSSHSSRRRY